MKSLIFASVLLCYVSIVSAKSKKSISVRLINNCGFDTLVRYGILYADTAFDVEWNTTQNPWTLNTRSKDISSTTGILTLQDGVTYDSGKESMEVPNGETFYATVWMSFHPEDDVRCQPQSIKNVRDMYEDTEDSTGSDMSSIQNLYVCGDESYKNACIPYPSPPSPPSPQSKVLPRRRILLVVALHMMVFLLL